MKSRKEELIDEICSINELADPKQLRIRSDEQLEAYLDHLAEDGFDLVARVS